MSRTPPFPIRFVQLERQEACPCSLPLLEQLDRLSGLSADEGNPDVHNEYRRGSPAACSGEERRFPFLKQKLRHDAISAVY